MAVVPLAGPDDASGFTSNKKLLVAAVDRTIGRSWSQRLSSRTRRSSRRPLRAARPAILWRIEEAERRSTPSSR